MGTHSEHLGEIVSRDDGVCHLQVVFVDIVKYSKRKAKCQKLVIDKFTEFLDSARTEVSKKYIEELEKREIQLRRDLLVLPTGDGAVVVFSFHGIHDIHLSFAKSLLEIVYQHNRKENCHIFSKEGSCDCHSNFHLRVGISEGQGIVFKDINERYNVAGSVINMVSRVMSAVDAGQIGFTEEGHRTITEFVPKLVDSFSKYPGTLIKHGDSINLYQYIEGLEYLNNHRPSKVPLAEKVEIGNISRPGYPIEQCIREGDRYYSDREYSVKKLPPSQEILHVFRQGTMRNAMTK